VTTLTLIVCCLVVGKNLIQGLTQISISKLFLLWQGVHHFEWEVRVEVSGVSFETNSSSEIKEVFFIEDFGRNVWDLLLVREVDCVNSLTVDLAQDWVVIKVWNSFAKRHFWSCNCVEFHRLDFVSLTVDKLLLKITQWGFRFISYMHWVDEVEINKTKIRVEWIHLRIYICDVALRKLYTLTSLNWSEWVGKKRHSWPIVSCEWRQ
jgi:hypothetical protein